MPPKGDPFKKVKIATPKTQGRGDEQYAELMKSFLEQYDDIRSTLDAADSSAKQEFIDILDNFQEDIELGTSFSTDKADFQTECANIQDQGAFFKMLKEQCGFDVNI